ncbi:ABC transporter permease [Streptomyces sp. NPDC001840]
MKRGIALGVFTALAFSAMLIGAFGVLLQSGSHAKAPAGRYASAVAVVSGAQTISQTTGAGDEAETTTQPLTEPDRVPDALAGPLAAVPGVRHVVVDLTFPVTTSITTLPGHGWDSAALTDSTLSTGRAPQAPTEVVLDAGTAARARAHVGSRIDLQTMARPEPFTVTGIADGPAAAYFTAHEAGQLSGHPGSADALVVLAAPGTSVTGLEQAAPGQVVSTGAARGAVADPAVGQGATDLNVIAGSMAGLVLITTILVVTGVLGRSVRDRTRELAVMRAVGVTPRQVRAKILRETLKVALPAAATGAVLSLAAGAALLSALRDQGVVPAGLSTALGAVPVIVAIAVTLFTAVVAALLTTRRISRIAPVQALGEAQAEPGRFPRKRGIAGVLLLLPAAGLTVLTALVGGTIAAAAVGILTTFLICSATLLGPWIARAGAGLLGLPLRLAAPRAGRLAATGAKAQAIRLAAVTTPVALAVGFGATQLFMQTTLVNATTTQAASVIHAEQILTSSGAGVPVRMLDELQAVGPAGTAATAVKKTTVVMSLNSLSSPRIKSVSAEGITNPGASRTLDPGIESGSLDNLRGNTVALSSRTASDLRVGDTATLWLGDGTEIHPEVVAVYSRDMGAGDVLLPYRTVADHASTPLADYVLVAGTSGPDTVTGHYFGVRNATKAEFGAAQAAQAKQGVFVSLIIVAAIAGLILINLATMFAVTTAARRRELGLLRMVGATRRQIMRMLCLETGLVLATGTIVGTLIAAFALCAFASSVTGLSMLSAPPALCAAILAAIGVTGLAAVVLTAWPMLRRGLATE